MKILRSKILAIPKKIYDILYHSENKSNRKNTEKVLTRPEESIFRVFD